MNRTPSAAGLRTTAAAMVTLTLCVLGLTFPVLATLWWGSPADGIAGMLVWDAVIIVLMRHKLSLTHARHTGEDDYRREQIAQVIYRGR